MKNEYRHNPVMLEEVIEALSIGRDDVVVDGTLGGAGHSSELVKHLGPDGMLIGIDQDEMAREAASKKLECYCPRILNRDGILTTFCDEPQKGLSQPQKGLSPFLVICDGNFSDLDKILLDLEIPQINKIMFDLGISSPQLDISDRGFTYHGDAPLDMRMDPSHNDLTAEIILNTYSEGDICRILYENSEDKWASRLAQFICKKRALHPFKTSDDLVEVIKEAVPASARANKSHPAKRVFQALRVEVNDEFGTLKRGLEAAIRWLAPSGKIAVITYHSIEDRIVKDMFKEMIDRCSCPPELPECICGKKPVLKVVKTIYPTSEEIERNPRSRSAKLRVATKLVNEGLS